jgi:hypothetical protein
MLNYSSPLNYLILDISSKLKLFNSLSYFFISILFVLCTFFLSYPLIPISVNASHISNVLTVLSNGDELLRDGNTLTSNIHGFNFLSIITSKPNISKQDVLLP